MKRYVRYLHLGRTATSARAWSTDTGTTTRPETTRGCLRTAHGFRSCALPDATDHVASTMPLSAQTSDSKQVCSVTMEHFQFDFHFPLNACTRHGHPAFTHFTSYSLLPDFTTLNSRFNEIAHSLTASFTASMFGYVAPCTTSFPLYSHS